MDNFSKWILGVFSSITSSLEFSEFRDVHQTNTHLVYKDEEKARQKFISSNARLK